METAQFIKIEDTAEPSPTHAPTTVFAPPDGPPVAPPDTWGPPILNADPKDPEGFLRRCSGQNKKTRQRCSAVIGRNAKTQHPTFLPTCHAHRDQQSFAGWCQFMQKDGERCGRLFRWIPPYFELCSEHQGHPDTPCYFMKLPLELRLEVFRYLIPQGPIGSSTSVCHQGDPHANDMLHPNRAFQGGPSGHFPLSPPGPVTDGVHGLRRPNHTSSFRVCSPTRECPFPLMNLFLINRQVYAEAKDLLFSTVPFTIDIRRDGTFMCGRRLLEPRRPDGRPHLSVGYSEEVAKRFVKTFDFASVKNYNVDILVENWDTGNGVGPGPHTFHRNGSGWDEEVEIYDIRDYVSVAVSGIIRKSKNLCRLNIRLGLSQFQWSREEMLANYKRLVGPLERLRNVRQPRLLGVFEGTTNSPFMLSIDPRDINGFGLPFGSNISRVDEIRSLCSIPKLPTHTPLLGPGDTDFDAYKRNWEKWLSATASTPPQAAPIRAMFTEFKQFYTKLSEYVPDVQRPGRTAFLHRARVARENEDVEAFRELRNELIVYWEAYLSRERARKQEMTERISRMLDKDTYPSIEDEKPQQRRMSASSESSSSSPLVVSDEDSTGSVEHMRMRQIQPDQQRKFLQQRQQQIMTLNDTRSCRRITMATQPGLSQAERMLPGMMAMPTCGTMNAINQPSQCAARLPPHMRMQLEMQSKHQAILERQRQQLQALTESPTQQADPRFRPSLPESGTTPQHLMMPHWPEQQKMTPVHSPMSAPKEQYSQPSQGMPDWEIATSVEASVSPLSAPPDSAIDLTYSPPQCQYSIANPAPINVDSHSPQMHNRPVAYHANKKRKMEPNRSTEYAEVADQSNDQMERVYDAYYQAREREIQMAREQEGVTGDSGKGKGRADVVVID